MMSTQNQAEHAVIHSSITLLQERFKQLQRVKEMREKKELLRLFSDHYNINATTTTATTTTTTTTTPCSDSSYNHEPPTIHNNTTKNDVNVVDVHDNDNDDVEELQIFLPLNYYYYSNYNRTNNKPTPSNSSSLSHHHHNNNPNNYHNHNHNISLNEISLSLWPPANNATTATAAATEQLRRGSFDAPLSKLSRPPSSCLSSAFKFEDSHHVSDVDTTLHL